MGFLLLQRPLNSNVRKLQNFSNLVSLVSNYLAPRLVNRLRHLLIT